MSDSRAVVIVGTGRCGSSALAGAVAQLGVHFCDHLVGPDPNFAPRGHWECAQWKSVGVPIEARGGRIRQSDIEAYKRIIKTHQRGPVWAIKDPYLSWSLGSVWDLFEDLRVIAIHRSFTAVVDSRIPHSRLTREQAECHQMQMAAALHRQLLTLREMGVPLLHTSFERLVDDPAQVMLQVSNFIFDGLDAPTAETVGQAAAFIEPSYRNFV